MLQAASKEEEATASYAVANEISVDAPVTTVLSEQDERENKERQGRLFLVEMMFSLYSDWL